MSTNFVEEVLGLTPAQVEKALKNLHKLPQQAQTQLLDALQDLKRRKHVKNCQVSLLSFIKHIDPTYKIGRHHRHLARLLEASARGESPRVTVSMPPRFGKSQMTSIYFPAWFMGNYPDQQVMLASHTADLAVDFGRKVRNLIDTDKFREIFPDVSLASDSKSAGRWNTNKGGVFFAVGVGGAIAGRGADFLCIAPGSKVISRERGVVRADTVRVGEHLWGFGGFGQVEKTFHSCSTESVTFDGCTVTPNHPVWVFGRGWVDVKELTTHDLLDTVSLWSYIRLGAETLYGQADKTWRELQTGVQHLGDDAAALRQSKHCKLQVVWWARHQVLRAVARFQCFFKGYGHATRCDIHPGSAGLGWGLHARELSLGRSHNAGGQPTQRGEDHSVRQDAVGAAMGSRNWDIGRADPAPYPKNENAARTGTDCQAHELGAAPRHAKEFGWIKRAAVRFIGYGRQALKHSPRNVVGGFENIIASRVFGLLVGVRRCRVVSRNTGSSSAYVNFQVSESNTYYVDGWMTHNCIDDAVNEQDLISGNYEVFDKVYEWYTIGARPRLMPNGRVAIVATRWAENDLIGRVVQDSVRNPDADQWEVVEFPALMEKPDPDTGAAVYSSLWPEQWSLESLLQTKATMPAFQWAAQYMQQPTNRDASIIKREWWQTWEEEDPPECEYIIMSLDAAAEKNTRSDFTAITTWGVFYKTSETGEEGVANIILLNAIKERMEFPELKRRAYREYQEWKPDTFIIEKKSAGTQLYQELRAAGTPVSEYTPHRGTGDKFARLNSVADIFESGLVWYPAGRRWAEEVVDEVCGFPNMQNDDLCLGAGTAVTMADGSHQLIELVQVGDFVATPEGPRRVLASHCTGVHPTFSLSAGGVTLVGTGNHPIATSEGWKRLDTITMVDTITMSITEGVRTCRGQKKKGLFQSPSCSTGVNTTDTQTQKSERTESTSRLVEVALCCIAMYGSFITGLFRKACMYTIKTETLAITRLKTWSALRLKLTSLSIMMPEWRTPIQTSNMRAWLQFVQKLQSGIKALKEKSGTAKTQLNTSCPAGRRTWRRLQQMSIDVITQITKFAKNAVQRTPPRPKKANSAVTTVRVEALVATGRSESVFNLSVEGAECYFANGFLVHNCDTAIMAMLRFRNSGFIRLPSDTWDDSDFVPRRAAYY